jgi:hypothetical protein
MSSIAAARCGAGEEDVLVAVAEGSAPKIFAKMSSLLVERDGLGADGDETSSPSRSAYGGVNIVVDAQHITYILRMSRSHRLVFTDYGWIGGEPQTLFVNTNYSPTPMTVAFNSGGGMRSNTPSLNSPRLNRLANSTDRCCSSSSGLVVNVARIS